MAYLIGFVVGIKLCLVHTGRIGLFGLMDRAAQTYACSILECVRSRFRNLPAVKYRRTIRLIPLLTCNTLTERRLELFKTSGQFVR